MRFPSSRDKVAPLKKTTIPRMELTAATVALRINKMLVSSINYPVVSSYFWTDSESVLKYIANDTARYHTFVANGVSVIRDASSVEQWRYVSTADNPADHASRGMSAEQPLSDERWLRGPEFLGKPENEWPSPKTLPILTDEDQEVKKVLSANVTQTKDNPIENLILKTSKWSKLVRVVGWVLRFVENCRIKTRSRAQSQKPGMCVLSVEHLERAERVLVRQAQQGFFEEMQNLATENGKVKKTSVLYRLDPIIDDGILRVGGRLERACISYDAKHPILMRCVGAT